MHYLVVPQTKIPQQAIVLQDGVPQLLYLRFVLEVKVALQESFIELYNLTQRQVLSRRLVKSPRGLDQLYVFN